MNLFLYRLTDALLHWHSRYPELLSAGLGLLKTSLIITLAWLAAGMLRHRSARARSWVWRMALLSLAGLALWQIRPDTLRDTGIQIPVVNHSVRDQAPEPAVVVLPARAPIVLPPVPWFVPVLRSCNAAWTPLWLAGFVLLAGWKLLRGVVGLAWLRKHSRPAPDSMAKECPQSLRCRISSRIGTPLITGLWNPVIWLPESSLDWTEAKRRAAFQHELAHSLRRDTLWQSVALLAASAWWWQPMAWFALRKMRAEAELAADDWSITETMSATDYAEALVDIAKGSASGAPSCVGIAMAETSEVEQRVRSALRPNRWRNKFGWVSVLSLILLTLGLAGVVLIRAKSQPPQYISTAKLVAGGSMTVGGPLHTSYLEYLEDFYGTISDTLESKVMNKQAMERVRLLHPELKEAQVEIHVTKKKGSAIFDVSAISPSKEYAPVFLNGLLDEFRAFREFNREQQRNKAVQALAEDVVKADKAVKESAAQVAEYEKQHSVVVLQQNQNEAASFLKSYNLERQTLRIELAELELDLKDVDAGIRNRERQSVSGKANHISLTISEQEYLRSLNDLLRFKIEQQQVSAEHTADHVQVVELKKKITDAETLVKAYADACRVEWQLQNDQCLRKLEIVESHIVEETEKAMQFGNVFAEYQRLKKNLEASEATRKETFDLMHKFNVSEGTTGDYVSVMERPEKAVELPLWSWSRLWPKA